MGGGGRFGITDPNAYVLDVLKKAAPAIQKELPSAKCPADPAPARTILAGHSGGGPEATAQADAATPATAPKDKAQWINRPRLMIFDGIHGPDELGKVVALAKRWVKEDIGIVTSEGKAALAERGLKLRSTFSTGGWKGYTAYNVGGTFKKKKVEGGKVVTDDKGDPVMVEVKVDPANALRGRLKALIEAEAKDPDVAAELLKQYVVEGPLGSSHERTMGVGKSPEELKQKRDASPLRAHGAVGQGRPALRRRRLPRGGPEEAARRHEAAPDATDARRDRDRARGRRHPGHGSFAGAAGHGARARVDLPRRPRPDRALVRRPRALRDLHGRRDRGLAELHRRGRAPDDARSARGGRDATGRPGDAEGGRGGAREPGRSRAGRLHDPRHQRPAPAAPRHRPGRRREPALLRDGGRRQREPQPVRPPQRRGDGHARGGADARHRVHPRLRHGPRHAQQLPGTTCTPARRT